MIIKKYEFKTEFITIKQYQNLLQIKIFMSNFNDIFLIYNSNYFKNRAIKFNIKRINKT